MKMAKTCSLAPVALLLLLPVVLDGCTNAGRLKSDAASLEAEIRQLKAQGALQTTPREIAIAEANLAFFHEEYDERDYWAAEDALAHVRENVEKAGSRTNLASDGDGDGVADIDDLCPEDLGPAESQGCPGDVIGQPLAPGGFWGDVSREIVFQAGSTKLMRFSERALEPVVATLLADPTSHVRVEGHTDSVGDAAKNRELSLRRAEAVKAYLIGRGVDPSQVSTTGYGSDRPIASNDVPEGRRANRRVEIRPE